MIFMVQRGQSSLREEPLTNVTVDLSYLWTVTVTIPLYSCFIHDHHCSALVIRGVQITVKKLKNFSFELASNPCNITQCDCFPGMNELFC